MAHRPAWRSLAIVAFVCAGLAGGAAARADWPQWRGPNHDGVAAGASLGDLARPPAQKWSRDVGVGYASVAIRGDKLFTAGWKEGRDTVWCLSADTGEEVWRYEYPADRFANSHEGGPAATPAVSDKHVFAVDRKANLYCLDAGTGKPVWKKELQKEFGVRPPTWAFAGSALLLEDKVVVDAGKVFAFEPATGKLLWQTQDYGSAYSTPAVFKSGARQLLAALPHPGLVILDPQDGKQVATYPWTTSYGVNASTPVVANDLIVVTTGYNTGAVGLRLEGDKLVKAWQTRDLSSQVSTPVAVGGNLYGFDESKLTCLDLATGKARWSERGLGKGALIAADGKLVVLSERGELIVADASPEKFKPLQRVKAISGNAPCWVAPAASGGRVYCRGPQGQLVCFDTGGS